MSAAPTDFQPAAYGITGPRDFLMSFSVVTFGPTTFDVEGYTEGGPIEGVGSRIVNGQATLTLYMPAVPPSAQVYGNVTQTSGAAWNWYSADVHYPIQVVHL